MMKKSLMKLAPLLILAVLVLTGCHGKKSLEPFEVPAEFDENAEYYITFWAKNDTNKTQTAIYNQAIADFEEVYPNIHVNLKLYTNYQNIYNDVITNISTDTTPNVCITYPDHIATYMSGKNVMVPLDGLMKDEAYGLGGSRIKYDTVSENEIIDKFLREGKIKGKSYALPFMRSTEAVYINRDFVEKLGYEVPKVLTWDYIFEVSEAAMKKDSKGHFAVNGQDIMIPFIYKSTDNMMIQMLAQMEAGYSTEDGEVLIFNEKTRNVVKTVAEHGSTKAFSTFKISSYPANFLNAGQCVFAIDSTAGSTWMGSDAPLSDISEDKIIDFETEVRMVPQFDPSNPKMISQGPSVCLFNKKDSGEVMASWIFMQYLLTNKVQNAYYMTEGYIPVTKAALESKEYQSYLAAEGKDAQHYEIKLKATKLLIDNIDNSFVTPVFNGSASLRDAAGQLIENTVKSVRRGETVDEAYIEKLFLDVSSLYRLDSIGRVSEEKTDLGPLPVEAWILIGTLVATWVSLGIYWTFKIKRNKDS